MVFAVFEYPPVSVNMHICSCFFLFLLFIVLMALQEDFNPNVEPVAVEPMTRNLSKAQNPLHF